MVKTMGYLKIKIVLVLLSWLLIPFFIAKPWPTIKIAGYYLKIKIPKPTVKTIGYLKIKTVLVLLSWLLIPFFIAKPWPTIKIAGYYLKIKIPKPTVKTIGYLKIKTVLALGSYFFVLIRQLYSYERAASRVFREGRAAVPP